MFEKRLNIFAGHFGSGKTEVSVNFALILSEMGFKTAIVDLDIVNPFFRTADISDYLKSKNIQTILPVYANTNVDIPALPAEISTVFENKEFTAVFDVGGDDLGAKVLSRYRNEIIKDNYEMYCVINTKRQTTDSADKIETMINEIENSSGLKITGLVNNTNLLSETKINDLIKGQKIIDVISDRMEIPVSFISSFLNEDLLSEKFIDYDIFEMKKQIFLPWEK
jgi:nitrogenase subunit NifH